MASETPRRAAAQFIEDLFIVDWDPNDPTRKVVYHIPEAVWKAMPRVDASGADQVAVMLKPLLDREVTIADVPKWQKDPPYYMADLTTIALNEPKDPTQ